MAQTQRVSGVATTVRAEGGRTVVRYHSTDVVEFDRSSVTLRTGGYQTVTTKRRMNQASNEYRLGFSVYQRRGEWYVHFARDPNRADLPFDGDEVTFAR